MRIINLVTIKAGVVDNIESYAVWEEQLVQDVVDVAEKRFLEIAKELGWDENEEDAITEEELLDGGYFECETGTWDSICISWSDVV
jgi:hypothetical protein